MEQAMYVGTSDVQDENLVCMHESLTPELIAYLYPEEKNSIQHPFTALFRWVKQWAVLKFNLKPSDVTE